MKYTPLFDAAELEDQRRRPATDVNYVYDGPLALAINVALAAGRPLLLSGAPGTGKSTVAEDIAWKLRRRFYPEVVTSRTKAQDLQWSFDAVRRLAVATGQAPDKAAAVVEQAPYIKPGVLWRAFAPHSAAGHGDALPPRGWQDEGANAVVLLDEIDKAEPDVPNDLLAVLDQREFVVRESGKHVAAEPGVEVLIIITTNGERDLPPAFLRRCITHTIALPAEPAPLKEWMRSVVYRHFSGLDAAVFDKVYEVYDSLRKATAESKLLRAPSTAELLDAFRACQQLRISKVDDGPLVQITEKAIWKHTEAPSRPRAASTGGTEA